MINRKPILVAAAAIIDKKNRVLNTQRLRGTHLAGKWEFPGGKQKAGETTLQALARELNEELGIAPENPKHLITLTHHYPEKTVKLSVWVVTSYSGQPEGREGQPIRWQKISELDSADFPAADYGIIRALQLPDICAITPDIEHVEKALFLNSLEKTLTTGVRLLILRCHSLSKEDYLALSQTVTSLCSRYSAACMLNMPVDWLSDCPGANIHLRSSQLLSCNKKLDSLLGLVSASCHSREEIEQAMNVGVDFVLLSPVKQTQSHPDAKVLDWKGFADIASYSSVPVYALGGMTIKDLAIAQTYGAQGISGISGFWDQ